MLPRAFHTHSAAGSTAAQLSAGPDSRAAGWVQGGAGAPGTPSRACLAAVARLPWLSIGEPAGPPAHGVTRCGQVSLGVADAAQCSLGPPQTRSSLLPTGPAHLQDSTPLTCPPDRTTGHLLHLPVALCTARTARHVGVSETRCRVQRPARQQHQGRRAAGPPLGAACPRLCTGATPQA